MRACVGHFNCSLYESILNNIKSYLHGSSSIFHSIISSSCVNYVHQAICIKRRILNECVSVVILLVQDVSAIRSSHFLEFFIQK